MWLFAYYVKFPYTCIFILEIDSACSHTREQCVRDSRILERDRDREREKERGAGVWKWVICNRASFSHESSLPLLFSPPDVSPLSSCFCPLVLGTLSS